MILFRRRDVVGLSVLVVAAASLYCSGDISDPQAQPAMLVAISGNEQDAPVGQSLPDSIVVLVEDGQGRAVGGIAVDWAAGGGGSVSSATVMTTADGRAAVERTLGLTAGQQTTSATVHGLNPLSFSATAEAGELPQLVVATQPSSAVTSGIPFDQQPIVRADDGTGEPLGAGIPVTVSVTGTTLSGTTTIETDEYGEVRYSDLALSGTDGVYVLTFSAPDVVGIRSGPVVLTSASASKARLVVKTQPSASADGGVPLSRQPAVQVEAGDGQPLGAGIPVTAAITGATLAGTTTISTNASGVARFSDLAIDGPDGAYRLDFAAPEAASARSSTVTLANATADGGHWSAPFDWPIVAVHMVLLPTARVLTIGRLGTPQVWDPVSDVFTPVPSPAWLFCAGHALLSDGRVLIAGGHISDGHGLPNITYFSGSEVWSSGTPMARGRWYPTSTVMGNGDVVILAGTDEDSAVVTIPEVWSNGTIRQLTGANQSLPWYPRAFLAPDGSLFVAGSPVQTRFLSTTGTGAWTNGPRHLFNEGRNYGSAVMYDDGKILYAGGAQTTNTAEVIDLNQSNPSWQWTGSMAFARRHLNLTVLPTGEVLATGGVGGTTFNDLGTAVHAAELWNPGTGQWRTLASNAIARGYHSTSLLLPDGRVLHSGSGNGAGAPDERNAEIYSPPYLFHGSRPQITSAPSEIRYGEPFRILTPQAGSITHVSLIRLGAVTHAFDENQRFQRLSFTADATGLTVMGPGSSNRAPPGHYMVFILNGADVPSVASITRIY